MTDSLANPTDSAICGLLAAGPLPTAALAVQLGIPERTARHRLYRLRQAGAVVTGMDGLHHLAAPATTAPIAGPLPPRDRTATTASNTGPLPPGNRTAATTRITGSLPAGDRTATTAPAAGGLPPCAGTAVDRAAPVMAPDRPDHNGPSSRPVGGWSTGTVVAVDGRRVAAVAGIAVAVAIHRSAPPSPPSPSLAPPRPLGFGYPGDPWGLTPW